MIDYSLEESENGIVVRHELRRKTENGVVIELGLQVYGPERCYFLTIVPGSGEAVSLQTARAVRDSFRIADMTSGICKEMEAEVIIYDEFDGDLLMVAGCDAEGKNAYERAAAADKWILETEFQCYGEEQEFPETLLQYMDISKEEAEAIWKSGDYTFQMDKWGVLTGHMTKMPVPEEFIGLYGIEALGERFRVIRE